MLKYNIMFYYIQIITQCNIIKKIWLCYLKSFKLGLCIDVHMEERRYLCSCSLLIDASDFEN
jgi:hypothetical protein